METVTRKVIENPNEEDYERFKASGDYEEIQGGGGSDHGSAHGSEHDDHKTVRSHHHGDSHRSRSVRRSKSEFRSKSRHHRSKSRRRSRRGSEDFRETRVEISDDESPHRRGGRLELIMPDRTRRKGKDLKAEIKALEAEKRALRHERDAEDRHRRIERHRDYSSSDDDGEVRIEKDRRGRLNLVKSN